ncbi:MAG TPA: TolC family protein [Planctomycetota bacterium]|nr:TolC family protein [Planctomycetota bacterium]
MRRLAGTAVLLASAGCAVVDQEESARALARAVRERTGVEPAAWTAELDATTAEEVRRLLADGLSEDDAVKIALVNNRAVFAAYERLGIARAELVRAGLLANPVLDADAEFFSGGTEIEVGLLQPVLDLFHRPLRERFAEHELAAATAAATRELVHLAFDVRRALVGVRAARRLVELQRMLRDVNEGAYELMAKLHAAGNVTDPELTAERIALAEARLDLAAAEQAEREAREPVNALLGLWGRDVAWEVDGPLGDDPAALVDEAHVEARSVAASLDLVELRARIGKSAQQAGLADYEGWFPAASAGVAGKREQGGEEGFGPALSIALPLFDAGGARRAGAAAALRESLQREVQLAVEIRAAARLLRDRFVHACERLAFVTGELLPARARFVRETLQNYNAMQIGAFTVFAARRAELLAEREHLEALRDAWLARIDLEELLAGSYDPRAARPRWPRLRTDAGMSDRDH